ncbi:VOC family protein [Curtobacterium sp. MCPF17_002]|uniref:VOC family protein n=1 Tax=Curtobacterium sp. MCPF17_002 TaxID=2175645 RepID=UPI000DAA72A3|nr:VOC family protein [Curtobacterium sp. MCPF17_002]WIB79029.1 VOC family protein [Curtobacterium sp. MCPF17_002]
MSVRLNPYIGFRDRAREALGFYQSVFHGEVTLSTFGEAGMAQDPVDAEKVMHGQLEGENGLLLMVSDAPTGMESPEVSNISISLSGDDEDALTRYWNGLAEGASIIEPLTKAPWGDTFGMLTDRLGVTWLVNITGDTSGDVTGDASGNVTGDVSGAAG